jgi:branched-chain amino acid transport system ATP-binding protein
MLRLEGVSKSFGGVRAVVDLDLVVNQGEICGLIGPNGSGKTTTVNLITGLFPVTGGKIFADNHDITQEDAHRRVAGGIARTFQNIRLFQQLSVWENLWVAYGGHRDGSVWRGLFGDRRKDRSAILEILEFMDLSKRADAVAGNLALGEQRRLELARAIAAGPKLLLLDEPVAGMTIQEISEFEQRLHQLRKRGLTILLIEHHMALVMRVCDRITVLNFGQRIAAGTPDKIQSDPLVQEAYLGASVTGDAHD